jgi:hypothetical protein
MLRASTLRFGPPWRIGLACIVCALIALLVWPGRANQQPSRTVADLIAPLAVGRPIARGYVLEGIRRGSERDLVLMAQLPGSGSRIEMHVVNRGQWTDVPETASFGIAYEAPRSSAPAADCLAATHALEAAVRANDPGGLAPIDAVALEPGAPPPPWMARAVARVSGAPRMTIGFGLVLVTWLLASLPRGRVWAAAWLAALGLLLRLPELGLPFDRDQDVQRLFTGHLPIIEILTGAGLRDRHPPLYFLVLHVAEIFGQSEAVARAPAAIAGALVGPAVLYGAWIARRRAGVGAALAALAVTLSVELVRRSRECSDMPLFALFALATSATLVRASIEPSRRWRAAVVASHALALWTYYLAPLVLAGNLAAAWLVGLRSRPALRAVAFGALLGAPALALEAAIFARDSSARAAADTNPMLAWGKHGAVEMGLALWRQTVGALGAPLLAVAAVVGLVALVRGRAAVLVPLSALAATFAGIALIAPFARVQVYYIDTVLPLVALAVATGLPVRRGATACAAGMSLVVALGVVPRLQDAYDLYLPSREAVMPALAETVARQPERRVLVTADYDTTILAYYLARRQGVPMDWEGMDSSERGIRLRGLEQELVPLVRVHSPGDDPDGAAVARLDEATRGGSVLVLSRQGLGLTRLDARLATCDVLLKGARERLLRCSR